jgi:xanthine dehydrogenase accessory factor
MLPDIIEEMAQAARNQQPFWLVTVIDSQGSSPGKPGMKMIVYTDGRTSGTVGGGQVEQDVVVHIKKHRYQTLARLSFEMSGDFSGRPGMACGGSQEVLIEPFGLQSPLYIIGAGHCAVELSDLAARCGFSVTVIDDRLEWCQPQKHPRALCRLCRSYTDFEGIINFSPQAFIVIMTHQHAHDEEALRACLGKPWRYLGMIGSRRKAGLLLDKLASEGIDRELLQRVCSPIGLPIGSQTPAEIAVSICAQLIADRNKTSNQAG